jgi:hypothetical protein
MLTQTSITGSDDWWLVRLAHQLGSGFPRLKMLESYRDGKAQIPEYANSVMREGMAATMRSANLNMAELISSTQVSRQTIQGFRTAAPGDDDGDSAAWTNWKRSGMRVRSRDFLRDAADFGEAHILVTGPNVPDVLARPLFLPSNGWTTAVSPLSTMPWLNERALVAGYDAVNQADVLTLFGPRFMRQAFRTTIVPTIPTDGTVWSPGANWSWVDERVPLFTQDNPLVTLQYPHGQGEFEKQISTLDRINKTILDRLIIVAMQAFKQRYLKGELPEYYPDDDPLGRKGMRINYNDVFKAGPDSLWVLGSGVEVDESTATDITPILTAVKDDTKIVAAATSTPMYILVPDAAAGSAEGASLARESFVAKVQDRNERVDTTVALAQGLAFQAQADMTRSDASQIETIFAPVTTESISTMAAASAQAKTGGLSQDAINTIVFQMTPAQLARERQARSDELFEQAQLATDTTSTQPAA